MWGSAGVEQFLKEEMTALAGEKPATKEELNIALNGLEMSFLTGLEGLPDRAETLQGYAFYVGEDYGPEDDINRYRAVSAERIKSVIDDWLSPDNVAVIEVHPKEQVEEDPVEQVEEEGGAE